MIKSYCERLFSKSEPYAGHFDCTYEVMSDENFVENGRCLKRTVVKT